jgi:hypothetical protein
MKISGFMAENIFTNPTKVFEESFNNPSISSALIVVLLAGIFLSLAAFLVTTSWLVSIYFFIINLAQWIILSAIVWFFEFIHVRKRKRLPGNDFSQSASVVGKLWVINLAGSVLLALVAFILPFASDSLMFILGPLFLLVSIVLIVCWLIASFKMLKVVFGKEKLVLFINWLIINILNIVMINFVASFISIFFR